MKVCKFMQTKWKDQIIPREIAKHLIDANRERFTFQVRKVMGGIVQLAMLVACGIIVTDPVQSGT